MKLTYSICQDLIKKGRGKTKKLDNNTYLMQDDSETPRFFVQLHGNTILVIYPDKVQHFDAGWQTVTTKDRLNKFGHLRIFQKKGIWYTTDKVEFTSGVSVYYA